MRPGRPALADRDLAKSEQLARARPLAPGLHCARPPEDDEDEDPSAPTRLAPRDFGVLVARRDELRVVAAQLQLRRRAAIDGEAYRGRSRRRAPGARLEERRPQPAGHRPPRRLHHAPAHRRRARRRAQRRGDRAGHLEPRRRTTTPSSSSPWSPSRSPSFHSYRVLRDGRSPSRPGEGVHPARPGHRAPGHPPSPAASPASPRPTKSSSIRHDSAGGAPDPLRLQPGRRQRRDLRENLPLQTNDTACRRPHERRSSEG